MRFFNKKFKSFRLRDVVKNANDYLIFTTLPTSDFIESLWQIVQTIGNQINACLDFAYGQVTHRNGDGEGQPHYFMHVGATSICETIIGKLIKGKNHGIKAANLLKKLGKIQAQVKAELKRPDLESEEKNILKNANTELIAQYNATLLAVKMLPEKTQAHLQAYQKLDAQNLEPIKWRRKHQRRFNRLHPYHVQETPKKPSKQSIHSRDALIATEPPSSREGSPVARKLF